MSGQNSCLGTNVSGHERVWAQMCLAQMCVGTNVSGHKRFWEQSCMGTIVSGHKRVWAQTCLGTNMSGHKCVWAQSCGPNHVWVQTWWNHFYCMPLELKNSKYFPTLYNDVNCFNFLLLFFA